MGDRPAPGEHDEARVLAFMRQALAGAIAATRRADDAWSGQAAYRAIVQASRHDRDDGHLAELLLFWVLGHDLAPEHLAEADRILNGDDPRRAQVEEFVHQVATGAITWDTFEKRLKKGLIKRATPTIGPLADDAVPLPDAAGALEQMLGDRSDANIEHVASTFFAFARCPVAPSKPLHVESDMCLFQWGSYDWGDGLHFECDFTRQFVLHDTDGDYSHIEQLSLTTRFSSDDPDLASLGSGELWSGDDLAGWMRQISDHPVMSVLRTKATTGRRLDHSEV